MIKMKQGPLPCLRPLVPRGKLGKHLVILLSQPNLNFQKRSSDWPIRLAWQNQRSSVWSVVIKRPATSPMRG